MVKFSDISSDIFDEYVVPNLLLANVNNICKINMEFFIKKSKYMKTILNHQKSLKEYQEKYNIDIYDTIANSSIDILDFDIMYNKMEKRLIKFRCIQKEFTKDVIKNTIILLLLIKENDTYDINICSCNILNAIDNLFIYLKEVFYSRNKYVDTNTSNLFKNILKKKLSIKKIDINLYDLYENYIFLNKNKRSAAFKKYITDYGDSILINNNNIENIASTIQFTILLVENTKSVKMRLYIVYEMYRYLNIIINEAAMGGIDSKKKFLTVSIDKVNELLLEIENKYYDVLPDYFKNILMIELCQYKDHASSKLV